MASSTSRHLRCNRLDGKAFRPKTQHELVRCDFAVTVLLITTFPLSTSVVSSARTVPPEFQFVDFRREAQPWQKCVAAKQGLHAKEIRKRTSSTQIARVALRRLRWRPDTYGKPQFIRMLHANRTRGTFGALDFLNHTSGRYIPLHIGRWPVHVTVQLRFRKKTTKKVKSSTSCSSVCYFSFVSFNYLFASVVGTPQSEKYGFEWVTNHDAL